CCDRASACWAPIYAPVCVRANPCRSPEECPASRRGRSRGMRNRSRVFPAAASRHRRRCCDGTEFQTGQSRPPAGNRDQGLAREKLRTRLIASLISTLIRPFPTETTGGSRQINQPVADRIDNQLGGLVGSQSIHHVGTM